MNKTLVTSVIAAAGIAVSGLSFAASANQRMVPTANPLYVGVGLNYNAITSGKIKKDSTIYKFDNSKVGYNLFVGNRLTKHFGTEAQFSYIGKQAYKSDSNAADKIVLKNLWNIQYDGYLYMPIGSYFDVFANGGLGYLHAANEDTSSNVTTKEKLNTFALNVGAGVQYSYQNFGVRFGYNHYIPQKSFNGIVNAVQYPDIIKLDVMYRFG